MKIIWKIEKEFVNLSAKGEVIMKTTKKLIQALNYIAIHQPNKMVGFKKAYKLLWLIDRYSIRHYARTVSGDQYFAMQFGPVPTDAKHILEGMPTNMQNSQIDVDKYLNINQNAHKLRSRQAPAMDVFSQSDIKVMDLILQYYGNMSSNDLSTLSHEYPEWKAYKEHIENASEKNSYPINPILFFEEYDDGSGVFTENPKMLGIAKDMWNEYNAEV